MAKKDDIDYGQIRMGSTMMDKYLLACVNSGFLFKVVSSEIERNITKKVWQEFISLLDLPVIDSYKFTHPSPTLYGAGGLETHLPFDIARPEFAGYQNLGDYLESLKDPGQRIKISDVANNLVDTKTTSVLHGIFTKLVNENRQAVNGAISKNKRLLASIEPVEQN